MSSFKLYSHIQKENRNPDTDVYLYDSVSDKLKTQTLYIIKDLLGKSISRGVYDSNPNDSTKVAIEITNIICREEGWLTLPIKVDQNHPYDNLFQYILEVNNPENYLDIIQVTFHLFHAYEKDNYIYDPYITLKSDIRLNEAITELNQRFKQNRFGYKYENNQIFKIDSEILHQETVIKVLNLVSSDIFKTVNKEFLSAHEHYRHSRYNEALIDCLKAFESTLKVICTLNQWEFDTNKSTAKDLLTIVYKYDLIPTYLQSHLSGLRSALEAVATIRNRNSGHGGGIENKDVPEHYVTYCLNLTGSNIVFLINCAKILK